MQRDIDLSRFGAVIESLAVGAHKPERAIYGAVTGALGVDDAEIIYLDDFEQNLQPALELGWTVIHVASPEQALAELECLAPTTTRSNG